MSEKSIWTSDSAYLIGFLSSVLLSITPAIQIFALVSKKINVDIINLFPLICLYTNCGLFFFQQLLLILNNTEQSSTLPILNYCNLIGFCFSLIWCIIVIYYKNIKNKMYFYIYVLLFIVATALAVAIEYLMKGLSMYQTFFNIIASIFNVLMYLSSGFNTVNLFRMKNFNYISIAYVIIGLVNCVIWLIFGLAFGKVGDNNIHIVISNSLGIIITIFQIVVYYKYRNEYFSKYSIRTTEAPLKIDIEGKKLPDDIGDL